MAEGGGVSVCVVIKSPSEGPGDQAGQTLTALCRKLYGVPVLIFSLELSKHLRGGERLKS